MKNLFISIIFFIFLLSCETVSKKIDENIKKEEENLSKWLNKTETELKIEFGKPDQINFKDNSSSRFYIYNNEKLKIKCQRVFEINQKNFVIGFTSKNCF
tara:strand:- start:30 stop:329 length:300 start_codon:yes stop_codon:yes gene_type:complete